MTTKNSRNTALIDIINAIRIKIVTGVVSVVIPIVNTPGEV